MYIRKLTETILYAAQKFPIVTLTGPRQSGKTTLLRNLYPERAYVNLEDLDTRAYAKEDPRGFLAQFSDGVILDEAQHVPELFSYIQSHVDEKKQMGEFILSGSQNMLLSEKIAQSLAGRSAILQLLPCSLEELERQDDKTFDNILFQGFYPAVHDRKIDPTIYYKSYVNTYIERDIRSFSMIKDLTRFRTFLSLCAGRIGQLVNFSEIGNACGVELPTIKSWISICEQSYILFLLRPHHKNFNKRLVKQPKLYFYDTGLACYLLGIDRQTAFHTHYAKGSLFENFVAIELLKQRFNQGKESNLFFWRNNHGKEMDFILEGNERLDAIEVKSGATINPQFFKGLEYWKDLQQKNAVEIPGRTYLVYGGSQAQERNNCKVLPWHAVSKIN